MQKFSLSDRQAAAILDMRLQKLTGLEHSKLKEEMNELGRQIERFKQILSDVNEVLAIIKQEFMQLKQDYGDARRTEIVDYEDDLEIEDLIKPEDMVVTITHSGYIKRIPVQTYKVQGRGGKGVIAATTKEEDFVEHLFVANTHSYLLVFTSTGQVHWVKVYQIPEAGRQARGKAIVNLLELSEGEKVNAVIPVKEFTPGQFLFMSTKNGTVKKTALDAYSRPRKGGIKAILLDDNDELIDVKLTSGKDYIILASKNGKAIKFREQDARPMGRTARGVRGIYLKGDDEVIALSVVDEKSEETLLSVTENGYGKRTALDDYRLIGRGGSGVINIQCSDRNGKVVTIKAVADDDELMLISLKGIIIRTRAHEISKIGRNTQGVRIMRLTESDRVVAAARVINEN
jgi:DNA gyrase subunit A